MESCLFFSSSCIEFLLADLTPVSVPEAKCVPGLAVPGGVACAEERTVGELPRLPVEVVVVREVEDQSREEKGHDDAEDLETQLQALAVGFWGAQDLRIDFVNLKYKRRWHFSVRPEGSRMLEYLNYPFLFQEECRARSTDHFILIPDLCY